MAFVSQRSGMNKRMIAFVCGAVILWTGLLARLFYLQVVEHDYYQQIVVDQLMSSTPTTAERGKIYDTNMNLLVTNTTVYRVFISPFDIAFNNAKKAAKAKDAGISDADIEVSDSDYSTTSPEAILIADKLAEVLGVDYNTVMEKVTRIGRRDETIQKNVDPDTAEILRAFIKENKLTGMLNLSAESKRYYCYGDLACHVLGFTNSDGNGIYGVEATYNDYLKGVSGKYITAKNALQQDMPFKYESYVGAENGANLVTTLDMRLQYELENQLKATFEASQAGNRVCGLVMDVNTGGLLASAVYPNFDCNDPYQLAAEFLTELEMSGLHEESEAYQKLKSELTYTMWNNKVISEAYEPGSTFKIITSAIGLEEDVVKVDDMFTCYGSYRVEGYSEPIPCHRAGGHGKVTFARGLQQSCNPTMMALVERIGRETFYKYFEAFGYTAKTGVDLPGEVGSIIYQEKEMGPVELATHSFGQTFKVTPLQQLTAICTVANGGYLVTPHIMKEMVDDDGNVIYSYESEEKLQVLSEDTCKTLASILAEGVATDGGAKNAYVKGYSVAAKTGTSQKQDIWIYYDAEGNEVSVNDEWVTKGRPRRIGSTVAFAPADDPQIAVLIMVDEPMNGSMFGSVVAAPYISKFLTAALPYIGVEANYTEEDLKTMDVPITDLSGMEVSDATLYISNRKLEYKIIGSGNTVVSQSPESGSRLQPGSGVVYLYVGDAVPSETAEVPDLMGKTASACNRLLTRAKLNIRFEGSQNYDEGSGAIVIAQSPAAGTQVPIGTVVTVEFRHMDGTD